MSRDEIDKLHQLILGLEKTFDKRWEEAIQQTSAVGSDVKNLKADFQRHMEEDRAFKEEMRPVLHGKRFVVYLGDFFKFLGVPLAAIGGFVYWFLSKLY